jgi:hypothetical protein
VFPALAVDHSVGLAIAFTIARAAPPMRHRAVDRGLKIRHTAELNVELTPVRSGQLFDTLKAGLELVASARADCIFPGQISASRRRFSKSHTGSCRVNFPDSLVSSAG